MNNMKNIKSLLYAAVAVLLLPLTSCSDDDYPQVPAPEGQEVYFSESLATDYTLSRNASTVEIPVMRVKTDEAETVQIMSEDESGLFTIPSSVTFAAGSNTANIAIAYNFGDLALSETYPISLLVKGNDSAWGQSQVKIKLTVPAPWIKLGKGLYRDDIIPSAFNGIEVAEREIDIYEYDGRKGYYYLDSPYDAVFIAPWFGVDPSQLGPGNVQPVQFIIDATDPNAVVIGSKAEPQALGCLLGSDGWISIFSQEPGTLKNGIITFPAEGLRVCFSNHAGSDYPANVNGMFRVVLPGVTVQDCAMSAAYDGMKISADGASSALFNLSFGADVASYKYVVAEGDVKAEFATVVAGIVDGSLENIAEGSVDATTIAIALDKSGMFSFVAVPYNAAGEAQTADAIMVAFFFPGAGGGSVPEIECALELNYMSYFNPEYEATYPATNYLGFYIEATDVKSVTYYFNSTAIIENAIAAGETHESILSAYGYVDQEIADTLNSDGYYLGLFGNRQPNTSYTMLVWIESIYGKKYLLTAECTTANIDYTGELILGDYYMTYKVNDNFISENTFTLEGTEDPNEFFLVDLGIEDGTRWHATYDASASTLTCAGLMAGNESKGSFFGKAYAYFDTAETQGYGLWSYVDVESDSVDDPLVFKIDSATKQIVELTTYLDVFVIKLADGSLAGFYNKFAPGTPVELEPATASVRTKALGFAKELASAQNAGMRRGLEAGKMIGSTNKCTAITAERTLRTVEAKAEPFAREKKESFKCRF